MNSFLITQNDIFSHTYQELIEIRDELKTNIDEVIEKQKMGYGDIYPYISKICLQFNDSQINIDHIRDRLEKLKMTMDEKMIPQNLFPRNVEHDLDPIVLLKNLHFLLFTKVHLLVHSNDYINAAILIFASEIIIMRLQQNHPNISIKSPEIYLCWKNLDSVKEFLLIKIKHKLTTQISASKSYYEYLASYSIISGLDSLSILKYFFDCIKGYYEYLLVHDSADSSKKCLNDVIWLFLLINKKSLRWFTLSEKDKSISFYNVYEEIPSKLKHVFDRDYLLFETYLSDIKDFCHKRQLLLTPLQYESVNTLLSEWILESQVLIEQLIPVLLNRSSSYVILMENVLINQKYIKKIQDHNFTFILDMLNLTFSNKLKECLSIYLHDVFQKLDKLYQFVIENDITFIDIKPYSNWICLSYENMAARAIQSFSNTPFPFHITFTKAKQYKDLSEFVSQFEQFSTTFLQLYEPLKILQIFSSNTLLKDTLSILYSISDIFFNIWYEKATCFYNSSYKSNNNTRLISCAFFSLYIKNNINNISTRFSDLKEIFSFHPSRDAISVLIKQFACDLINDFKKYVENIKDGKYKHSRFQNVSVNFKESETPINYSIPLEMSDQVFSYLHGYINSYFTYIDCTSYEKNTLTSAHAFIFKEIFVSFKSFEESKDSFSAYEIVQAIFDIKCIYLIFLPDSNIENSHITNFSMNLASSIGSDCNNLLTLIDASVSRFIPNLIYILGPIMSETALFTIQNLHKISSERDDITWSETGSYANTGVKNFLYPIKESIEQVELIQL